MRYVFPIVFAIVFAGMIVVGKTGPVAFRPIATDASAVNPAVMKLTSPSFADGGVIPGKYTCGGDDISPPLSWTGIPKGTTSLLLTVVDADAPRGSFVHWMVWNISPRSSGFGEGDDAGPAVQGRNSAGNRGYTGPCPSSGTHRYVFTLYALAVPVDLPADASWDMVLPVADAAVGSAKLTGVYSGKR